MVLLVNVLPEVIFVFAVIFNGERIPLCCARRVSLVVPQTVDGRDLHICENYIYIFIDPHTVC